MSGFIDPFATDIEEMEASSPTQTTIATTPTLLETKQSEEDTEESITEQPDAAVPSKKRRRSNSKHTNSLHIHNISKNPFKIRLPKIVTADVRRKYAHMLVNVLNSMDMNLIISFFEEFTHSETIFRRQIWTNSIPRRELLSCVFYGIDQILAYVYLWGILSPDRVVEIIGDVTIVTRSDSFRSEISFEYQHLCHLFYKVPCPNYFLLQYYERYRNSVHLQERKQIEKDLQTLQELSSSTNVPEDTVIRMEELEKKRIDLREQFFKEIGVSFRQEHEALNPPSQVTMRGRMTFIIDNIYEQEQLDEIIVQSYGLF